MRVFIELPTWLGDSVMASAAIENIVANYKEAKITFFGKGLLVSFLVLCQTASLSSPIIAKAQNLGFCGSTR